MTSSKHKCKFSLQQVLDSILNDDPENDVSGEESSEEEFDYNDVVTEGLMQKVDSQCSFPI